MAELAIRLKVFIASPSDVRAERDVAESELIDLQRECADLHLLVAPYRWEGRVPPGLRRPQIGINQELRTAELTIVIIWSTLGTAANLGETGSMEEWRIAGEQVLKGYSDDVFVYLKTAAAPPDANTARASAANRFKEAAMSSPDMFAVQFETTDEFRTMLRRDLRLWIQRWRDVPDICGFALMKTPGEAPPPEIIGENRLARRRAQFDPLTVAAAAQPIAATTMWAYQEAGPHAAAFPLNAAAARNAGIRPLFDAGVLHGTAQSCRFCDEEWFYLFCAMGLHDALLAGDLRAVERRAYVNPIHQYLQGLAVGANRNAIIATLRRWLTNENGATEARPVARNFAAYVLGMLGATESHEDLARVAQDDDGEFVRQYCVASLGRLRARAQLPVLTNLFKQATDAQSRLFIAQAVSRMVGVADYAL